MAHASKPRILLLSGYDAASHRYWRKGLQQHLPEFEWTQLALPDRHFSWRMRGNGLIWATGEERQILAQDYDLLIATSMVDLAGLRGLVPQLASIPTIVYFHENQFEYPLSPNQSDIIHHQLQSIYAALCADRLQFNTAFNRDTFFAGAQQLLKRLPDKFDPQLLDGLQAKSSVVAVPIELPAGLQKPRNALPTLLWNHRWEYDKQPQIYFDALALLKQQGIEFKLNVVGQSFRQSPECFAEAKVQFADDITHWGYQPSKQAYQQVLIESDIVVSAAAHDFQGLAMLEAMAYGCVPVAPDRLAYREYIDPAYRYSDKTDNEAQELAQKLVFAIEHSEYDYSIVEQYGWQNLRDKHLAELLGLCR